MKTKPEVRQAIIDILDREDAWDHAVMHYISSAKEMIGMFGSRWRGDGFPKRSSNVGRIVTDLAVAIGNPDMAKSWENKQSD